MLVANYSGMRSKFKEYCDLVVEENEAVIVSRKGDKNVVLISLDKYNSLIKAMENANYLEKLALSNEQIKQGQTVVKSLEDLELLAKYKNPKNSPPKHKSHRAN